MISQVKGLVLFSLLNKSAVCSKVSSSLKTTIRDFHLQIPHKKNPHAQINQLAVTAKILSQPGTAVCGICSSSIMANMYFHGLQERLPWVVQHSGLIWTEIILVVRQALEKHSYYNMVQWNIDPLSNCVFSNRVHCTPSACSTTMWL